MVQFIAPIRVISIEKTNLEIDGLSKPEVS
jgi:hypothetical protein